MELVRSNFKEIKRTNDPEQINDFLIKLSEDPYKEYLEYIEYFKNNLEPHVFEKVKLNLIFLLGEIGKVIPLGKEFITLLIETYYSSDRWIRNEVIQTISKISEISDMTDDFIKLVGYAINDEYTPIKLNALRILLDSKVNPLYIRRNLFIALNSKDFEIEKLCIKIFEKFIIGNNELFNSLNYSDNYIILKPKAIRALLLIYFKSLINLESFREKILTSEWQIDHRDKYFKEIDTYEKILLKRI